MIATASSSVHHRCCPVRGSFTDPRVTWPVDHRTSYVSRGSPSCRVAMTEEMRRRTISFRPCDVVVLECQSPGQIVQALPQTPLLLLGERRGKCRFSSLFPSMGLLGAR